MGVGLATQAPTWGANLGHTHVGSIAFVERDRAHVGLGHAHVVDPHSRTSAALGRRESTKLRAG
jgi:hypothetical protein